MTMKLVSQMDQVKLVYPWDEAIDRENSDREQYKKTADPTHIKILDGHTPVVFYAGVLNGMLTERLNKMEGKLVWEKDATDDSNARSFETKIEGKAFQYFRYCIKRITGIDGLVLGDKQGFQKDQQEWIVGEDVIRELQIPVILYIGGLCLKLNTPEGEDEKNSGPR